MRVIALQANRNHQDLRDIFKALERYTEEIKKQLKDLDSRVQWLSQSKANRVGTIAIESIPPIFGVYEAK